MPGRLSFSSHFVRFANVETDAYSQFKYFGPREFCPCRAGSKSHILSPQGTVLRSYPEPPNGSPTHSPLHHTGTRCNCLRPIEPVLSIKDLWRQPFLSREMLAPQPSNPHLFSQPHFSTTQASSTIPPDWDQHNPGPRHKQQVGDASGSALSIHKQVLSLGKGFGEQGGWATKGLE